MTPPTLNSYISTTLQKLKPVIGEGEARASLRMIFEAVKGWSPVDTAIKGGEPVSPFVIGKVDAIVNRMLNHEPLQYILGEAWWYGLKIHVTPAVLIPRPETAELVDLIVKQYKGRTDMRVADICTGSGCIACALARNLPFSRITAIDNSPAALEVAQSNGETLRVSRQIEWVEADALDSSSLPAGPLDIVVSNPPYIALDERGSMEKNVLLYEPHTALFVPDDDPLRFYRAIAGWARTTLVDGGRIFFEINPIYADRLADRMREAGWADVTLVADIHAAKRFLIARHDADNHA